MKYTRIDGPLNYENGVIAVDDLEIATEVRHDDNGDQFLDLTITESGNTRPFLRREPSGVIHVDETKKRQALFVRHHPEKTTAITIGAVTITILDSSTTSITLNVQIGTEVVGKAAFLVEEEEDQW